MRLKRLEIYGYKSFATRSVFEFGGGITAIVGPNGSGKSNIADAVRWVLGEQSFRLLRAHTSEDMIFAGTSTRSRLGMAEVILTFDNPDGWLPIDYSEVSVGRRAYRSGENEYLLNGNRVRFRDIADLLGTAGLVRSSYLVIGQGMVDAALSLRPEARRVLFEEAAGLAPHLRRREESLDHIAETERNLERAQDILGELRPRADTVRRQAERAEEYMLLRQDLHKLQRIWFGYEWQRIQRDLQLADERAAEARQQVELQRAYVRDCQQRLHDATAREVKQTAELQEIATELLTLRTEEEQRSRAVAVAQERRSLLAQQRVVAEREAAAMATRQGVLQDEVERLDAEASEQLAVVAATEHEIAAVRQELAKTEEARTVVTERLQAVERELAGVVQGLDRVGLEREETERRISRLHGELVQLGSRRTNLEQEGSALLERTSMVVAREQEAVAAIEEQRQRIVELNGELQQVSRQRQSAEAACMAAQSEHQRLLAKRAALERMRQELTGYSPGARLVLSADSGLQGIVGSVASLMTVPGEYEMAIEAALGPRMQNIVTERWTDAEAAIALLKTRRGGWATFLPLDTLRPPARRRVAPGRGVVGLAIDLISFDERLRPAFELLLGRVVVVSDLAAARALLSAGGDAGPIVTLEGDTVQPTGVLSGGIRPDSAHLLAQEREWRQASAQVASASAALRTADSNRASLRTQEETLRRRLEEGTSRLAALTQERDAAREARARQEAERHQTAREAQWLDARFRDVGGELQAITAQAEALEKATAERSRERASLEDAAKQLRTALAEDDGALQRRRLAQLETRLAVAQRSAESYARLIESHRTNLAEVNLLLESRSSQLTDIDATLAKLAEGDARERILLSDLRSRIDAAESRVEQAREERTRNERERLDAERLYASSLERLKEAESGANLAALQRERTQDQRAALAREIEAELGPIDLPEEAYHQLRLDLGDGIVELPAVSALPPDLDDDIRHLRARLRRLGDINPDAPREYEQLLERQTFLQGQISDLKGAIASLHEVIQELDAVIARDFMQTVRSVDEAFRAYFATLFGGGSARLTLTAPEQPDSTGVDILAQPPGKRAQPLSLLSGGERALTAVALLFALLKTNPVPFCFLDEVDAALDETNVGRFRDLLVENSRQTQFIVITHNRHTIDAASTVYGVSMAEQGISQTVSLRLGGIAPGVAQTGAQVV